MDGSIDRIKNANFSHSVRGYDRHEVDAFLRELADWLERGGDEDTGSEVVRARLERVGEQTAGILSEAHEAAETIREDAAAEARQQLVDANVTSENVRAQADEYRESVHSEADAYAAKTRADADSYAEQIRTEAAAAAAEARRAADREAERIVADANRRRRDIEAVIADLEQRREAVVAELDRLATGIAGTATQHRGSAPDEAQADAQEEPADGADGANGAPSAEQGKEAISEAETREQSAVQRSE